MSDQYTALKTNVDMLGRLLGEAMSAAKGPEFLDKVEAIRKAAKAGRASTDSERLQLMALLQDLGSDELLAVARAFNQFLNLANIADQHQTISRDMDGELSATQSLADNFQLLTESGCSADKLRQTVAELNIELVLTAHPTEITRRSLIHKYGEIDRSLGLLELQGLTQREQLAIEMRLRELIAQIWHTAEFRQLRPTPVDEARWGIAVIENSLWQAVPDFLRRLDSTHKNAVGSGIPITANPVKFVSWMGGDRDGNPNVTAPISREVLLLSRWKAAELYQQDLTVLIDELSMSACSEALAELSQGHHEPYRFVLKQCRRIMTNTLTALTEELAGGEAATGPEIFHHIDQLWHPLEICYQSLHHSGMGLIADGKLLDLVRRARCFGVHLVKLDIRQDSSRHTQALGELTSYLGLGDYASWSEADKQAFLLRELQGKRPLVPIAWQPSEDVQEVLETCRVVGDNPAEAFGAYVISMARQASDVLAVQLLLKETGCTHPMPVAPLFETLDDLNNAADVMSQLFQLPWYRGVIAGQQMVMIGYSDSAKDAGVMAAGWAQYRAQEDLLSVADSADVSLTLFHGRGGTIGRGGAPAQAALLSQPPGSLRQGLRVTEQGEMIRAKLGLSAVAIKSLAMYTCAILQANLLEPPAPKQAWRDVMEKLSADSCEAYRSVVREHPQFVEYFRSATPEQELAKLPLGSRPARRAGGGGVESLRAIPWIFSWSQNRLMLPAWLGAGAAIEKALQAGHGELLETMCKEWPFFSTRMSMLEMVFLKADPELATYYDARLVTPELQALGRSLRQQLSSDIDAVLKVANESSLMGDLPWIKQSVEFRNTYIDPLNLLQVELLRRNREQQDDQLEQAIMVTIAGISAGMRNTG